MLIVDIALPRDVEEEVGQLPHVTLRDLHHLRDWANRGMEARAAEADHVRSIVAEEVERFIMDSAARQAAPLIAQLREHAESVRTAEMQRFANRLADLSPAELDVVESITRGIVNKLLHSPSVTLREAMGTPSGERIAAAVRDLFDLH